MSRRGRPRVDDYEIASRVLDALEVAGRPLSAAELRRRVVGQGVRVDHIARLLLVAGRVRRVGRSGLVLSRRGDDRDAA